MKDGSNTERNFRWLKTIYVKLREFTFLIIYMINSDSLLPFWEVNNISQMSLLSLFYNSNIYLRIEWLLSFRENQSMLNLITNEEKYRINDNFYNNFVASSSHYAKSNK